jgi:sortase A
VTGRRITTKVTTLLVLALVLLGLWQAGQGAWIYLKAELAQALLQRAWAGTVAGQAQMKPWPWADTWPLARLTVPSKDIDLILLNGAYGRTLAFGPGYLETSASPGSRGTTILTGHRDTHFRFLERLQPGETIRLQQSSGRWLQFTVRDRQVVDSRSAWIRSDDDERHVVLITCYPFDAIVPGGPLRYVVSATEEQ